MDDQCWELAPIYRHSSSTFTPNECRTLVSSHQDRVLLRDAESLRILRTWKLGSSQGSSGPPLKELSQNTTKPTPPLGELSANSSSLITLLSVSPATPHFILVYMAKKNIAWILNPERDEPFAQIVIGAEGAMAMAWHPAGDAILVWSAHRLRICIHSIMSPTLVRHIHYPKVTPTSKLTATQGSNLESILSTAMGYSFRPQDSRYLAVIERHEGRDCLGVYDCVSWSLLRHITVNSTTSDLADIAWSPCGRYIAVWEVLTNLIVHIYTPDGHLLSTYDGEKGSAASTNTGSSTTDNRHTTCSDRSIMSGSGVKSVQWHPSGNFLAISDWDSKIRFLSNSAWLVTAELMPISKVCNPVNMWREPLNWIAKTRGKGIISFDRQLLPCSPVPCRQDLKAKRALENADMSWSPSGSWLASLDGCHPTIVCIWKFSSTVSQYSQTVPHSVISHQNPVTSFAWQPIPDTQSEVEFLAVTTGVKGFTVWRAPRPDHNLSDPGTAEGVGIPTTSEFCPTGLQFRSDGAAVLLNERSSYSVGYLIGGTQKSTVQRDWDDSSK